MKLKVGDIVEFKKYEDLSFNEALGVSEDAFPKYGKVRKIILDDESASYFSIENSRYGFNVESVARVIDLKPGDEVLVKATIKEVFNGFIQIEPSVDKTDVVDVLKHKEPERFIVKEDYYGMYIGVAQTLVSDKSKAKIYTLRDTAIEDASEVLPYDAWEVIPYGD